MTKFGYIINDKNILIDHFRLGTSRANEFESIMNINLSDTKTKVIFNIKEKEILNESLKNRIEYYLTIRNNENPDYGVDWRERFEKSTMFNQIKVLEKEMELFCGNEDNIIAFLANIYNELNNPKTNLSWFLAKNHKVQREIIKNCS